MRLEDQVVSLEFASKLKELGVKQESAFYWVKHRDLDFEEMPWQVCYGPFHGGDETIAAFTVAELGLLLAGEMLPGAVTDSKGNISWMLPEYFREPNYPYKEHFNTEADARAKMLIHLIESGTIKPNERGS